MCTWGTDVPVQVTVPAKFSYTGKDRLATKPIDACIAPIVKALNVAGIRTDGSCCGHGKADGWIALHDGRQLIVRANDRRSCIPNDEGEVTTPSGEGISPFPEPEWCDLRVASGHRCALTKGHEPPCDFGPTDP